MTREHFREFVSRLASQIGVEVARDQIESPLHFVIGEQRVIPDQDVSTQSPEFIIYAEIGPIDARRELEVMRMPLEGDYLWSQTRGASVGVNPQTRDVVLAWKATLSAIASGQMAGDVGQAVKGSLISQTVEERAAEQSTRTRQPTANDDRARPYR
jgi:hypothetical protein